MNPYLVSGLRNGVIVVERFIHRLSADVLDTPTGPGRFSPREVLAHLADWEAILRGRMEQTVAQPGVTIEGIDEGERALALDYASWPIAETLAKWGEERNATIAFLSGLDHESLRRQCLHRERGPMTVSDQANMLLGHDLYHIEQLTALL